jgi:predicted RNase H-like HicB family nuclease
MTDYRIGFQDALELCIAEIETAKTKEDVTKKLKEYLGLVLEDKIARLKQMLFLIKQ